MARARAGNITEGGATSAREAAAFVWGYLQNRYIPARRTKGALAPARAARLQVIAALFQTAAMRPRDEEALPLVLRIEASSTLDRMKTAVMAVFSQATGSNDAVRVLHHAAGILAAAGEAAAAEKFAWAAGVTRLTATGIFPLVTATATQAVQAVVTRVEAIRDTAVSAGTAATTAAAQLPAAATAAAQRVVTGAVNTAAGAVTGLQAAAQASMTAAEATAAALAASGATAIQAQIAAARTLAEKAATAGAAVRAEIAGRVDALGAQIGAQIAEIKQTGTAVQAALAAKLEHDLKTAMGLAQQAATAAQAVQGAAIAAVDARIGALKAGLTDSAQTLLGETTRRIGLGAAIAAGFLLLLLVLARARGI